MPKPCLSKQPHWGLCRHLTLTKSSRPKTSQIRKEIQPNEPTLDTETLLLTELPTYSELPTLDFLSAGTNLDALVDPFVLRNFKVVLLCDLRADESVLA